jgi:hypothetical protein
MRCSQQPQWIMSVICTLIVVAKAQAATPLSLDAPDAVPAGSMVKVMWNGLSRDSDQIAVAPLGAPDDATGLSVASTSLSSPARVKAPEQPGEYELRYLTSNPSAVLARKKITVVPLSANVQSASIAGPVTAVAGSAFNVSWQGPANDYDAIAIFANRSPDAKLETSSFVVKDRALQLTAPLAAGAYELRYVTAQVGATLAHAELNVTPAKQEPGSVAVSLGPTNTLGSTSNAVEVIVDASSSMLERVGSQRRIDIVNQTLAKLTSSTIPTSTPFALRVLGRDPGSCQSELAVELGPLNAAAVSPTIASIEPKQNAKAPLAASLDAANGDLARVKGRSVILIVHGDETCGGNPAGAIARMLQSDPGTRVNIVGFGIDDRTLAAKFRLWSQAGNGKYFEASDAAGLTAALTMALRPSFEIVDTSKGVVATGVAEDDPVHVMPGTYTVRLRGGNGDLRAILVHPKETTHVPF